jgi:HEAT repeat protein
MSSTKNLIEDLQSSNNEAAWNAAQELVEASEVNGLLPLLKSPNGRARHLAACLLTLSRNKKVIPVAKEFFKSDNFGSKMIGAWCLSRAGDKTARDFLIRTLGDVSKDPEKIKVWKETATLVITLLGDLKDPEAVDVLSNAMKFGGVYGEQQEIPVALQKIKGSKADQALIDIATTARGDPQVRAIRAIGARKSKETVAALMHVATSKVPTYEGYDRRKAIVAAVETLAKLKEVSVVPTLLEHITSSARDVHDAAYKALEKFNDAKSEKALLDMVTEGKYITYQALKTLINRKSKKGIALARSKLEEAWKIYRSEPKYESRFSVEHLLDSLSNTNDSSVVPILLDLLGTDAKTFKSWVLVWEWQLRALHILGNVKNAAAKKMLTQYTKNADPTLSIVAKAELNGPKSNICSIIKKLLLDKKRPGFKAYEWWLHALEHVRTEEAARVYDEVSYKNKGGPRTGPKKVFSDNVVLESDQRQSELDEVYKLFRDWISKIPRGVSSEAPTLARQLANPNLGVVVLAAVELVKKDTKNISLILDYQNFRDFEMSIKVLEEISANYSLIGKKIFLQGLSHKDWRLRSKCLKLLAVVDAAGAKKHARAMIEDENKVVQMSAATVLAEIGDSSIVPFLVKGLKDPDIKNDKILELLLKVPSKGSQEVWLTIVRQGLKAAQRAGGKLPGGLAYDVRMAAEALGVIGTSDAVKPLLELTTHDAHTREVAEQSLSQIVAKKAQPELITGLSHKDPSVVGIAARKLGELGNTSAVPHLKKVLERDEIFCVEEAIIALGKCGGKSAVAMIEEKLLDSTYAPVRTACVLALSRLKPWAGSEAVRKVQKNTGAFMAQVFDAVGTYLETNYTAAEKKLIDDAQSEDKKKRANAVRAMIKKSDKFMPFLQLLEMYSVEQSMLWLKKAGPDVGSGPVVGNYILMKAFEFATDLEELITQEGGVPISMKDSVDYYSKRMQRDRKKTFRR